VISAGTSDIPVAEEALVTAQIMGHRAEALYDVGGRPAPPPGHQNCWPSHLLHSGGGHGRALPSVVRAGGPAGDRGAHQRGYGASFGGLAALLAMLNSCATGLRWSTSTTVSAPATWRP